MKILKISSQIAYYLGLVLLWAGFVLHSVFEKMAQVYPATAYWFHLSGALLLIVAAAIEFVFYLKNNNIKIGLALALPSIVGLALIFTVLLDAKPFYEFVNLSNLAVLAYILYRLIFFIVKTDCKKRRIILIAFAAPMLAVIIFGVINYANFEQLYWDAPATLAMFLALASSFLTFKQTKTNIQVNKPTPSK